MKWIIFLALLGFLLGVTAISFHHHDNAFLLPACSLCKAKTSWSGNINKLKTVSPAVAYVMLCLSLAAVILCLSGLVRDRHHIFIDSQIVETYPNKAPPAVF